MVIVVVISNNDASSFASSQWSMSASASLKRDCCSTGDVGDVEWGSFSLLSLAFLSKLGKYAL